MATSLVDYPSSDSEGEASQPTDASICKTKRKRGTSQPSLPPLPQSFHDIYTTNVRAYTSDDPVLHEGRRRATPHIQGNWPSHIYIESNQFRVGYPSGEELSLLQTLLPNLPEIKSLLQSKLGAPLPLHVSLSRSLNLSAAQKDAFTSAFLSEIESSNVVPFVLSPVELRWVPNFERSRWFLVLGVEEKSNLDRHDNGRKACPKLNELLAACNKATMAFSLPWLYVPPLMAEPTLRSPKSRRLSKSGLQTPAGQYAADASDKFHVSIAWSLETPSELDKLTTSARENGSILQRLSIPVRSVKVKIGNQVTVKELDVIKFQEASTS